ncbi:MAG: mechanosensitive ion channel domain-containing protein [Myxococcales bacterium]
MNDWIQFVGPKHALQLFGVKLVGVNAENGKKLLFSAALVLLLMAVNAGLRRLARRATSQADLRAGFWMRQGTSLAMSVILVIAMLSVWFDDPRRLTTAMGLVTAGLAFALQRAVTALAGYFVILRGKTFNVGDRISMGGVRGDVIALGFMQTTIMEMGQPPAVQAADPAMWVRARQYSGRVVTVSNSKIFDEPIYNYTREFPYLWEEMVLPISYQADRTRAERIMLDAARTHTIDLTRLGEEALREMERRYAMKRSELEPRVYLRMTDNWLELTVRVLVADHAIRDVKDAITRDILKGIEAAGIGVASATFEIVGLPPLRIAATQPQL